MKQGSRFLGIDDGPHEVEKLIGVSYRGTEFMEQVEFAELEKDSGEADEAVLELYNKFDQEIKAILLDGVSFNGFNIADIERISEKTSTPVVAVTTNRPDRDSLRSGMAEAEVDTGVVDRLPAVKKFGDIYFQHSGIDREEAEKVIRVTTLQGKTPEPIRAAHLIGSGLGDH